jgi:hypothetical protein
MINKKKSKGQSVEEAPRPYSHNVHNAFSRDPAQSVSEKSLGKISYIGCRKWIYANTGIPSMKLFSLLHR